MAEPSTTNLIQQPLNIAFVVDRFGARYGGAEAYGVELMRQLHQSGHKITVFARAYDTDCDLQLPFHQIRVARFWPSWIRVFLFAHKAAHLTKNKFDLVHSHMNGWCGDVEVVHVVPVRYRWQVRKTKLIKKILNCLSPRIATYLWLESRRVQHKPGHVLVAVSKLIHKQLQQSYNLSQDILVIPPGVVAAKAVSAAGKLQLRQDLGLEPDTTICLLVARNPIRKGLATVLKALSGLPENIHLLVVGANSASKSMLASYSDQIQARVHLVAETSNVVPYYQVADIYVHPTLNDSFGMAPLEAMSFGLPVIMSPAPWCGFAEYVRADTEALLLKNPDDVNDLTTAINTVASDAALYAQLVAGAKDVVGRHTWAQVAKQYLALYAKSIAEKSKSNP